MRSFLAFACLLTVASAIPLNPVGGNYLFYKIKGTKYKVKPYDIPQRAFNPHKISLGSRGSTCITFHK